MKLKRETISVKTSLEEQLFGAKSTSIYKCFLIIFCPVGNKWKMNTSSNLVYKVN